MESEIYCKKHLLAGSSKGKHYANYHLIDRSRTYKVKELAIRLERPVATIHSWFKRGMPKAHPYKPIEIRGQDAYDFLLKKRQDRKQPCKRGQILCVACHKPQSPKDNQVTVTDLGDGHFKVAGLCCVCGTKMNQRVDAKRLPFTIGKATVINPAQQQE